MNILAHFFKLYRENRQIALLTWTYAIVAVVSVFIAGLLALADQSIGVGFLIVPGIAVIALCGNIVVWSLINSAMGMIESRMANRFGKHKAIGENIIAAATTVETAEKTPKSNKARKKSSK